MCSWSGDSVEHKRTQGNFLVQENCSVFYFGDAKSIHLSEFIYNEFHCVLIIPQQI